MILDKLAICGSALCAIHCLLTPIVLLYVPLHSSTTLLDEHVAHQWITGLLVPISTLALVIGYWRHQDYFVSLLGGLALVMLVVLVTLGHDQLSELGETMCVLVLTIGLIGIHIRNYSLCCNNRITKA